MPWTMPPEWTPHERTWMVWPCNQDVFDLVGSPEAAFRAWADAANAIARFEPVKMLCNKDAEPMARQMLDPAVSITIAATGDSWARDSGATFVLNEQGRLGAVDWTFNGWGGRTFPAASADAEIARFMAAETGAERLPSRLVNEGGGIHVDGEGTILLTETVQMNRNRNPNWTRAEIEAEFHAKLGTTKAIWLPRGLKSDEDEAGTDGHVDTLAVFVKPGLVLVHGQPDPNHPDHQTARDIEAVLRNATDAKGRKLEVIVVDAPSNALIDGIPQSYTYINFSFVNGGVVLCGFDDPQDAVTETLFRRLFNDRKVVMVRAVDIFAGGGGVHCITQQQPKSQSSRGSTDA